MEKYQEKNRRTLLKGIQALPNYNAPAPLWPQITSKLDQEEKLQKALHELPQYAAPTEIWAGIEQGLDKARPRTAIYRYLKGSGRWAAAAVISGLVICTWWLTQTGSPAKTTIAYSEEIHLQSVIAEDWNTEDQTMALVIRQAAQSPVADPTIVHRLKIEYDELTDARMEVQAMLKRYGQDEDLLKEIARIERERSQVIKELATWI